MTGLLGELPGGINHLPVVFCHPFAIHLLGRSCAKQEVWSCRGFGAFLLCLSSRPCSPAVAGDRVPTAEVEEATKSCCDPYPSAPQIRPSLWAGYSNSQPPEPSATTALRR